MTRRRPISSLANRAGWSVLFWLNPIFCFVVPFLFLMSAKAKRNAATLFQAAVAVLIGRWLDTYLIVGPSKGALGGLPLTALVGTGALLVILLSRLRQVLAEEASETSSATE